MYPLMTVELRAVVSGTIFSSAWALARKVRRQTATTLSVFKMIFILWISRRQITAFASWNKAFRAGFHAVHH